MKIISTILLSLLLLTACSARRSYSASASADAGHAIRIYQIIVGSPDCIGGEYAVAYVQSSDELNGMVLTLCAKANAFSRRYQQGQIYRVTRQDINNWLAYPVRRWE